MEQIISFVIFSLLTVVVRELLAQLWFRRELKNLFEQYWDEDER